MKRWWWFVVGTLVGLVLMVVVFSLAVLSLVRAAPGTWSQPVQLGPWRMEVSVPAVVRMATHPVVMKAMADREWKTRFGPLRLSAGAQPDSWTLVCAPCLVPLSGLGGETIELNRVVLVARRHAQNAWQGEFVLGDGARAVRGQIKLAFDDRNADFKLSMPDTPIANVYLLWAKAMPEAAKAQIDGRMRLRANLRLPQREWQVEPTLEGFAVSGLGTESLLNATPACEAPKRGFGAWLPRAVVAAEDQRFYEHTGYDLREIASALSGGSSNPDAPRGASTLSQQVAKLLYTGDARTHARKLRELLYAVELDRTLGKPRLLNLYLSMAPWGEGECGAAAAARHYLHKRVDKLTPMEAAWLASLLHNPDRDLAAYARNGQVDVRRVAWVIENIRLMKPAQREALVDALPEWRPGLR